MTDRLDLPPRYREELEALLRKHVPDAEVWAYGSRVNGQSHEASDLDLVVLGPGLEPLGHEYVELVEALEQSNIPILVQAHDWARLPESFHREIERHYVVVQRGNWIYETVQSAETEWRTASIDEIAEKVAMGPFGSSIKVETFVPYGVPIISGQHLRGSRVDDSPGFNFITEEHAERLSNANVQRGDIVFTHAGNISNLAYVPETSDFGRYVISQRQFYMRCDRGKAIPEFVTAYFKTPAGQHQLLANSSQVGVPSIAQPVSYLRTIEIPLPPLPEQRRIAGILGALDDKIELNRRMNETLEAMARAIFQDWFVDFGPVRAKLEGREPYLPPELWTLFPGRLVDSELGEIPQGWEVQSLGDLCEKPQYGYTASAQSDSSGPKFLRITDINKIPWIEWANVPYCVASAQDRAKFRIRKGDVLIARMADPGHGVMVEEDLDAVFASYLIRFRPRHANHGRILQYWLRSAAYWDLVQSRGAGTTRISLNATVLSGFPVIVPPYPLAECFANTVQSIRNRVVANVAELEGMTTQRDALLPKLVSGEVRVERNDGDNGIDKNQP